MSETQPSLSIIPLPRDVKMGQGSLKLGGAGLPPVNVTFPTELEGAGKLVHELLEAITGKEVKVLANTYSCKTLVEISLTVDPGLPEDTYRIAIVDTTILAGGSLRALQGAIASLLQLVHQAGPAGSVWSVPRCNITDTPSYPYTGLMVDLARKWHPVHVIEQCIVLCWWYKVRYLHLHFTDKPSYTLPSDAFPKLPTKHRHYTREEIADMNVFARDHGVTIVPEIDLPGHSRALVRAYPKLFGLKPFKLGRPVHDGVANIGKEESIAAISEIIKETCELFPDSPYFHLGADEVKYDALKGDPDVVKSMAVRGFNDVQELYRQFIVRMDDVVRQTGKIMCVWEGFGPEGNVSIPKDIPVFVFESWWNTADKLVADGYQVVNTSWQPIYVTRKHSWTPEQVHAWHPRRWENWSKTSKAFATPITIEQTPLLLGAEMCSWSQEAAVEIPRLRARIAAFVDTTWNKEKKRTFGAFSEALAVQDAKLELILQTICQKRK
jgi:hexosaminidase